MASRASIRSSSGFASLAGVLSAALALTAAPRPARGCADAPEIGSETTFDPRVLGDPSAEGAFYDPYSEGFGSGCPDCARKEQLADWAGWLPGVRAEDWASVLFDADLDTIDALIFHLQGKRPTPPARFERSSLAALPPEGRAKAVSALFLVGFARRVEPFAMERPSEWDDRANAAYDRRVKAAGDPAALQRNGEKALARATDPFLRQRYAFLLLRLRFYRHAWPEVLAFHEENAAALEGPSASLRWRARYYRAGALWRLQRYPEANVELARIRAGFPTLGDEALRDFHPMEEQDWQAMLALAKSPREQIELWQMVGVTRDALAAMTAIVAIDPSSTQLGLLAVRELNRLEYREQDLSALERLAVRLAEAKQTDRPWLFDLVAGHAAALRGDLTAARARLDRATRRAPASNRLVRAQASASLALALARSWRAGDAKAAEELAQALGEARSATHETCGAGQQLLTARRVVRRTLAKTCRAAGLKVEAELLARTLTPSAWWQPPPAELAPWRDAAFVEALLARVSTPRTAFDRFLVEDSGYTTQGLELELAQLHLAAGDFAATSRVLARRGAPLPKLGTDPFVVHVVDCHDCDHERYARAPWTLATLAARLAELQRQAGGEGEPAAKAAFALGSALYNVTFAGNARVVLADSHAATADTRPAEAWFKRAHDLSRDRELRARAAMMAAKCELARGGDGATVSKTWYPVLRSLADTAYQREVLRECGWYRDWAKGK